jgi:2-keto-4-pentenoate hydratase
MTPADLAIRLANARNDARALELDNALVASVDEAYAVQSQLAMLAGGDVRGWKVTALTPPDQAKYRATRAVAGPLFAPYVGRAPGNFALSRFVAPLIECEIAFVLAADLPARAQAYARGEVEAAVEAVVAAIEVADCRLAGNASDLMKLTDDMGNGALVTGTPIAGWRELDLTDIAITLTADNGEAQAANSSRILGNPLLALIALANAQPLAAGGLKKGQVVTTGSCTTPVPLRPGTYVGRFGPLGTVEVRFD